MACSIDGSQQDLISKKVEEHEKVINALARYLQTLVIKVDEVKVLDTRVGLLEKDSKIANLRASVKELEQSKANKTEVQNALDQKVDKIEVELRKKGREELFMKVKEMEETLHTLNEKIATNEEEFRSKTENFEESLMHKISNDDFAALQQPMLNRLRAFGFALRKIKTLSETEVPTHVEDAAGLAKRIYTKQPQVYKCLSCNRPVDVPGLSPKPVGHTPGATGPWMKESSGHEDENFCKKCYEEQIKQDLPTTKTTEGHMEQKNDAALEPRLSPGSPLNLPKEELFSSQSMEFDAEDPKKVYGTIKKVDEPSKGNILSELIFQQYKASDFDGKTQSQSEILKMPDSSTEKSDNITQRSSSAGVRFSSHLHNILLKHSSPKSTAAHLTTQESSKTDAKAEDIISSKPKKWKLLHERLSPAPSSSRFEDPSNDTTRGNLISPSLNESPTHSDRKNIVPSHAETFTEKLSGFIKDIPKVIDTDSIKSGSSSSMGTFRDPRPPGILSYWMLDKKKRSDFVYDWKMRGQKLKRRDVGQSEKDAAISKRPCGGKHTLTTPLQKGLRFSKWRFPKEAVYHTLLEGEDRHIYRSDCPKMFDLDDCKQGKQIEINFEEEMAKIPDDFDFDSVDWDEVLDTTSLAERYSTFISRQARPRFCGGKHTKTARQERGIKCSPVRVPKPPPSTKVFLRGTDGGIYRGIHYFPFDEVSKRTERDKSSKVVPDEDVFRASHRSDHAKLHSPQATSSTNCGWVPIGKRKRLFPL